MHTKIKIELNYVQLLVLCDVTSMNNVEWMQMNKENIQDNSRKKESELPAITISSRPLLFMVFIPRVKLGLVDLRLRLPYLGTTHCLGVDICTQLVSSRGHWLTEWSQQQQQQRQQRSVQANETLADRLGCYRTPSFRHAADCGWIFVGRRSLF